MADYNLEGSFWSSHVITYTFATSNLPGELESFSSYLQAGSYEQEITAALGKWSSVADLTFVQVTDSTSADIRFGFGNFDGPFGILGETYYSYDGSNHMLPDVTVQFDQGENYASSSQGLVLTGGVAFESVALHEIGHALGLDHYNNSPAIMNATASAGVTTFQQSDLDGIHALYGAPQTQLAYLTPTHDWSVDFNGDGHSDLLWHNADGRSAIWDMSSTGIASSGYLPIVPAAFSVSALLDVNGDGHSDLLWRSTDGTDAIWEMNGATIQGSGYIPLVPTSFGVTGTGDFNGDGKDDLLWRSQDGTNAVWEMNGTNITGSSYLPTVPTAFKVAGIGDFNGDHRSDILWHSTDGTVAMWTMNGTSITSGTYLQSISASYGPVLGDFNGDGKDDILWVSGNGSTSEWVMNGDQILASNSAMTVTPGAKVVGLGDFNGNGNKDVLWENPTGDHFIWDMNGTQITSIALPASTNGLHVQEIGDYNNDGKADILLRDAAGNTEIDHMNGASVVDVQHLPYVGNDWHII